MDLQQVIGITIRIVMCVEKQSQNKSLCLIDHECLLNSYWEEFYIFNYILKAHCYLVAVENASSNT